MSQLLAFFAQTMPGMPPSGGWLVPIILLVLGTTAVIDARRARVPDSLIFAGILFTTACEGSLVDWPYAGTLLATGFAAGFLLYLINEVWYRFMKRDAYGMGDAKWTVLAVSCFGPLAALWAWIIAAWLAIGWIGALRLAKRPIMRVHFTPFLFIGLCIEIYWLRLR